MEEGFTHQIVALRMKEVVEVLVVVVVVGHTEATMAAIAVIEEGVGFHLKGECTVEPPLLLFLALSSTGLPLHKI